MFSSPTPLVSLRSVALAIAVTSCVLTAVTSGGPVQSTSSEPMPTVQGEAAIALLKKQGSYASLQEAIAATRYRIDRWSPTTGAGATTSPEAYVARNPQQNYQTVFTPDQIRVTPREVASVTGAEPARWQLELALTGYGYGAEVQAVTPGAMTRDGNRVEITRRLRREDVESAAPAIVEWYVNRPTGLEQGFTIGRRPSVPQGDEPLRLHLAVRGGLRARVRPGAEAIEFVDAGGRPVLAYDHLVVTDATQRRLPSQFEVADALVRIAVDDAAAVYPVTIDPTVSQLAYIKASNTGSQDFFHRVAVSGDTAVVGAYAEDSNATGVNGDQTNNSAANSGAAYVFVWRDATWSQQAYLKASNTGANDWFGWAVAVSGDTIVVGAPNEASNATGVDGDQSNNSISSAGAAYVFVRSGGTWSQQAYLKAPSTTFTGVLGDNFGATVAVSDDTVVVGAPVEDSNAIGVNGDPSNNTAGDSGAAYVFVRSGGTWSQQAYLKASNTGADDRFGTAVAISGDTVVVGAVFEDSNATGVNGNQGNSFPGDSGAAYVFVRIGVTWSQEAYLKASNTGAGDFFGAALAVSGDTVVVGAYQEDSNATGVDGDQSNNTGFDPGAAYVFVRSGGTWSQQAYLKASNTGGGDFFGLVVAVSGDTVIVGAPYEDSNATGVNGDGTNDAAIDAGAAYVFVRTGVTWSHLAYLKASNAGAGDRFGQAVAVAGDTVLVGAILEDSNATGVNGSQSNNSGGDTGAAYTFTLANLIQNGDFKAGTTNWLLFATPDLSYIVSNVTGGVFQFYRNAPPAGTSNQAVAFQNTGVALGADAPILTQFDLGNADAVRKRISVLVHDSDFSDLFVCTFWLPAGAPLATYAMATHTTKAWSNATIAFYAASPNAAGNTTGFYRVDNVSMQYAPAGTATETTCVDPTAPTPPGGAAGATLLTNGDFETGTLPPWSLFGTITGAVTGGVFEFIKPNATPPAGVVLQATGQAMTAGQILTATFQLGNSSAVRKRVTVILHDNDFSDLSACTFWLAPGQALATYTYRTFTTKAWTNATLSVYPATAGSDQWIRLDNVALQRTPGTSIAGTECVEPTASPFAVPRAPESADTPGTASWQVVARGHGIEVLYWTRPIDLTDTDSPWLTFQSILASHDGTILELQVTIDGITWHTVASLADGQVWMSVDLAAFSGQIVYVRLVLRTVVKGV